jgi:4-amino-4-deoxy-L-arabinose transferase-like glycosyltransferase
MAGLLLAGAAVRIQPLADNRFHPDEALFATFARLIASGRDPLLASRLLDKSPLTFYLGAASVWLIGPGELAVRLPNLLAGVLTLALTCRLALRLTGDSASALASLAFVALSPLAILFAPTAFTDPQMTLWLLTGLVAVSEGSWGWAGLTSGLALASKQNALLFLPLVIVLGLIWNIRQGRTTRRDVLMWGWRFALPLAAVGLGLAAWDAARGVQTGFWSAGIGVNNPGRLIRAGEVWPRAERWLFWMGYLTASRPLDALLGLAIAGLLIHDLARPSRQALACIVIVGYLVGYLAACWLIAFNVYDRYLLPLIPLVAVLAGRALTGAGRWLTARSSALRRVGPYLAIGLMILLLVGPALTAARSGYPVGGDHGIYDGIEQVAAYLRARPPGTVVYDHWLSWSLGYYLFDDDVYVSWFVGPDALADDLAAFGGESPRYLVVPGGVSATEVTDAIWGAGFRAETVLETYNRLGARSFIVLCIVPDDGQ